jgi:hypothetical protein
MLRLIFFEYFMTKKSLFEEKYGKNGFSSKIFLVKNVYFLNDAF